MNKLLVVLACFSLAACSNTRTPPPADGREPDIVNVKFTEGTVRATVQEQEEVTVEPTRLVYPASVASVKAWKPGSRIVGDRRSGLGGSNAFGFLRKVMSVREESGQIIVETEKPTLAEVMEGQVRVTADPTSAGALDLTGVDVEKYFPRRASQPAMPWPTAPTDSSSSGLGVKSSPLKTESDASPSSNPIVDVVRQAVNDKVNISKTFNQTWSKQIVNLDETVRIGSADVKVKGTIDLSTVFKFSPYLTLAFETTRFELDYFRAEAGGPFSLTGAIDSKITVEIPTKDINAVGLPEGLAAVKFGKVLDWSVDLGPPVAGPTIYGVPTTFQLSLEADCSLVVRGSATAHADMSLTASQLRVGGVFNDKGFAKKNNEPQGWSAYGDFAMTSTGNASLTAGGGVKVECGITPRVNWLVADLGGPYLGIRGAVILDTDYKETCDPLAPTNGPADSSVTMSVDAYREIQVGGEVDLFKVIGFDDIVVVEVGPWSLSHTDYPDLWKKEFSFPKKGLNYCPADCQNGVKSKNETDVDCGANCNKCAVDKSCRIDDDCKTGFCNQTTGACAANACGNGVQDNNETDVDCGGGCSTQQQKCALTKACTRALDCNSGFCNTTTHMCVATACQDGAKNGSETAIDCGGSCPDRCAMGQSCNVPGDCAGLVCVVPAKTCSGDYCTSGQKDNGEGDVDCGGTCTAKCGLAKTCNTNNDCSSLICNLSTKRCVATTCEDGRVDGDETAIDCGGSCATKCGAGQACRQATDCSTSFCSLGTRTCQSNACSNGVKDGSETATDCGGSCAPCSNGKTCNIGADCATGACSANHICVNGLCQDGTKNGAETDVDCGGSCVNKCGNLKLCSVNNDCKSAACVSGQCKSDRCLDLVKNGTESDIDCGQACSVKCLVGKHCNTPADCASGFCNLVTQLCVATHCEDATRNLGETDVDCGGNPATTGCAADCANGKLCAADPDCVSTVCNAITLRCGADHCDSGRLDSGETDIDCGGTCSPGKKCAGGKICQQGSDCNIGFCDANLCRLDPCSNLIKDNLETDVDCGGGECDPCGQGKTCGSLDSNCQAPVLMCRGAGTPPTAPFTCATQCGNARQDGAETGFDCGGGCPGCPNGQPCNSTADCASGFCNFGSHLCVDHCADGVANAGLETDVDCGGTCAQKCGNHLLCNANTDCLSGQCDTVNSHACEPVYRSCKDYYDDDAFLNGGSHTLGDGPYNIMIVPYAGQPETSLPVYCKMTALNGLPLNSNQYATGGWTLAFISNSVHNDYLEPWLAAGYEFNPQGAGITGSRQDEPSISSLPNAGIVIGSIDTNLGMQWNEAIVTTYELGAIQHRMCEDFNDPGFSTNACSLPFRKNSATVPITGLFDVLQVPSPYGNYIADFTQTGYSLGWCQGVPAWYQAGNCLNAIDGGYIYRATQYFGNQNPGGTEDISIWFRYNPWSMNVNAKLVNPNVYFAGTPGAAQAIWVR